MCREKHRQLGYVSQATAACQSKKDRLPLNATSSRASNRPCRLRPHGNTGTCLIQTPPARLLSTLPPAHGCPFPRYPFTCHLLAGYRAMGRRGACGEHMHLLCCRLGARGGSTRIHSPPLLARLFLRAVRVPCDRVCVCVCNVKFKIIYDYADALPLLVSSLSQKLSLQLFKFSFQSKRIPFIYHLPKPLHRY